MYEDAKAAVRTPHGMTKKMDITAGTTHADVTALVADSREELKKVVKLWQKALADNGLRLSVRKMNFISSEQCIEPILDCQGELIENVFRYLGSDLSDLGLFSSTAVSAETAAEMRMLKWACGRTRRNSVKTGC
ncbi:unnamed protein product [Heligmosomoides polygyrus]|uniref:Reverse transcriptase domain-containing protein n=1 Tax=Heligmosomoides polygyrus TaxID=6339 RepID=A0A183GK19_HELPZ|nr:unnamed protein product [Heligmosomoides polygyrus]